MEEEYFWSTELGLWAVSVLLRLYLRLLMAGLGIYWVRTDLLILGWGFMGHWYGLQVMNYYQTSSRQWLCYSSKNTHTHKIRWLSAFNVFDFSSSLKSVFRKYMFNSLLKISPLWQFKVQIIMYNLKGVTCSNELQGSPEFYKTF